MALTEALTVMTKRMDGDFHINISKMWSVAFIVLTAVVFGMACQYVSVRVSQAEQAAWNLAAEVRMAASDLRSVSEQVKLQNNQEALRSIDSRLYRIESKVGIIDE